MYRKLVFCGKKCSTHICNMIFNIRFIHVTCFFCKTACSWTYIFLKLTWSVPTPQCNVKNTQKRVRRSVVCNNTGRQWHRRWILMDLEVGIVFVERQRINLGFGNQMHPRKITCPLKRNHFSREYLFQPSIFRGHVNFQGSMILLHKKYLSHSLYVGVYISKGAFESPKPS